MLIVATAYSRALQFPEYLIRVTLRAYQLQRHLSMGARISKGKRARRGLPAGDIAADAWIRLYTLAPMDATIPRHEPIVVDMFVDDLAGSGRDRLVNSFGTFETDTVLNGGEKSRLLVVKYWRWRRRRKWRRCC